MIAQLKHGTREKEGYLVTTRRKPKAALEVAFLGVFILFYFHFGIGPGIK